MGQAKLRGTYEERKAKATERDKKLKAEQAKPRTFTVEEMARAAALDQWMKIFGIPDMR